MGDVRVDGEAESVASLDGQSRGGGFGRVLVAADVLGGHVGDRAVGVVVGSHADILPVLSNLALVDQGGEGVYEVLGLVGGRKSLVKAYNEHCSGSRQQEQRGWRRTSL